MLSARSGCPVDYRLCNQTVTVYHWDGKQTYTRTVYTRAFFDPKKTQNVDKTGSSESDDFLLVLPMPAAVSPGDKILLGAGPEVADRAAWAALIPATVPGLVVAQTVNVKYWSGQAVHVEVSG